jgi:hypothetical protein
MKRRGTTERKHTLSTNITLRMREREREKVRRMRGKESTICVIPSNNRSINLICNGLVQKLMVVAEFIPRTAPAVFALSTLV